ncbi:MAG: hypothetical protein KOO63_08205 [Bacteroidales bacterium]|nr:hypothetical protein [Candidatus Latescibacterota bacterium]
MKKLAIVCGAPSSEMLAPFDDPEYEVWVLGNRSQNYPRYDLIFEIHDEIDEEHDERYPQWLVDKNTPLIVGNNFPIKADHVTTFPYDESERLFGSLYLTSSPAMMVCLAMLRGYPYMELYGIDLSIDDFEYFWQRPCMEAWIGFARGKGHEVVIHELSPVLKAEYVEGMACGGRPDFSKPPFTEDGFLGLAKRHQEKIAQANQQIAQLQIVIQSNDGARQAYTQMARVARSVEAGNDIPTLDITVRQKD